MIEVALSFCLLFAVIVFGAMTTKLLKRVTQYSNKISELRLENFSLTCDKLRLESENEFLKFQLNKGEQPNGF